MEALSNFLFSALVITALGGAQLMAADTASLPTAKKAKIYGRGVGSMSMENCEKDSGKGNCEKCLLLYYPKCENTHRAIGCNICTQK